MAGPRRRRGGGRRVDLGAWQCGESSSAKAKGGGELRRDAWEEHVKQEVASRPFHGGGCAEQRRRQRSRAGKQAGGRRIWTDLQFQKFQGPNCKIAITFNLWLK